MTAAQPPVHPEAADTGPGLLAIGEVTVFIGALPSSDRHVCRCDRLRLPCKARPTAEDGLCAACRTGGCGLATGVHMTKVGTAEPGAITFTP